MSRPSCHFSRALIRIDSVGIVLGLSSWNFGSNCGSQTSVSLCTLISGSTRTNPAELHSTCAQNGWQRVMPHTRGHTPSACVVIITPVRAKWIETGTSSSISQSQTTAGWGLICCLVHRSCHLNGTSLFMERLGRGMPPFCGKSQPDCRGAEIRKLMKKFALTVRGGACGPAPFYSIEG